MKNPTYENFSEETKKMLAELLSKFKDLQNFCVENQINFSLYVQPEGLEPLMEVGLYQEESRIVFLHSISAMLLDYAEKNPHLMEVSVKRKTKP